MANSLKAQTFLLLECQSKEKEILNWRIALRVSNSRNLERTFVRGCAAFQGAGGMVNEFKQSMCVTSSYVLLVARDSVRFESYLNEVIYSVEIILFLLIFQF